jgi:hypothetical protein
VRGGHSLAAIVILGIVGVAAGGLLAIIAFAHVAGRTTAERPGG